MAKEIGKMLKKSKIRIKGVDYKVLAEYLAKNMKKERIKTEKLENILPKKAKKPKRNSRGKPKNKKPKNEIFWIPSKKKLSKEEKKNLFSIALEMLIVDCMEGHIYQFANKLRLQTEGGAIGLDLTGEVADTFMLMWDQLFMDRLRSLGIKLLFYSRFKDDVNLVIGALKRGTVVKHDALVVDDQLKELEAGHPIDKVTMRVLTQIANETHSMIKFTCDFPSNYANKSVPILDMKANLDPKSNSIMNYEFYEKPSKNQHVILASSSLSWPKKRTILTQEALRRMRNTAPHLGQEAQNSSLSDFMIKLKNSGYKKQFRKQIILSAKNAYRNMKIKDESGKNPCIEVSNGKKKTKLKIKIKLSGGTKRQRLSSNQFCLCPQPRGGKL